MNEYEKTLAEMIEFLKQYSDSEIVQLINIAKLDYSAKQSSIFIPYKDLISEMERRDVDCSHVRNYNSYLSQMEVELRVIDGKKWLFANWMMMFSDEDYSVISNNIVEEEVKEDEIEADTDSGVFCPICEKICECGHLIAIYDDRYHSFEGGDVYDSLIEFEDIIHMGFRQLMKKGKRNPLFTLRSLKECWDDFQSRELIPEGDLIYIDPHLSNKVILDVLKYHGADWGTNEDANSGPGFSSSKLFLFANNTMKVIKDGMGRLREEFGGEEKNSSELHHY